MKTSKITFLLLSLFTFLLLLTCSQDTLAQTAAQPQADTAGISAEDAQAIARDAYLYGFPMVVHYKVLHNYVVDKDSSEYKGPFNKMSCEARLYTPDDRAVVTPNADTPYCMYWFDLRAEPMVMTVPEMDPERFYHIQFIDLYTHNYGFVGTLTTGNGAGTYLIAGSGWKGEKPEGVDDIIRSETDFAFNVARIQLFDTGDLKKVEQLQSGFKLQPLSAFLGTDAPPVKPTPDFPKWVEGAQFDERFFAYLDFMMSLLKTPGEGEAALWQDLASLGIGPENTFDFAALSPEMQEALKAGVKEGFADLESYIAENSELTPWQAQRYSEPASFCVRAPGKTMATKIIT